MPATSQTAAQPRESFSIALARRTLTQRAQFKNGVPAALREAAQALQADVQNLATGFDLQISSASRALVNQQLTVADDIAALFPGDRAMEMAASQFRAKASESQQTHRDVPRLGA
jgi:hypothetical protein